MRLPSAPSLYWPSPDSAWRPCAHSVSTSSEPSHTGPTCHLARLEHLVAQQQIGRDARARRDAVAHDAERVVHALLQRVHGFARGQVEAYDVALGLLVLQLGHCIRASETRLAGRAAATHANPVCRAPSSPQASWE